MKEVISGQKRLKKPLFIFNKDEQKKYDFQMRGGKDFIQVNILHFFLLVTPPFKPL